MCLWFKFDIFQLTTDLQWIPIFIIHSSLCISETNVITDGSFTSRNTDIFTSSTFMYF